MIRENIDFVEGDFNGASWRRETGPKQHCDSTLEEALNNARLLVHPRSTPLWGSGGIPSEWTDVCGFVKPPNSHFRLAHTQARRLRDQL